MSDAPPDADQLSRFRHDLETLAGTPAGRVGVALSGGPDSVAMLLLAAAAYPGVVAAATVDHGLRSESAAEAEFAARLCAARGIPHETLTPEAPIEGNLQSAARRARYALLDQWRRRRILRS